VTRIAKKTHHHLIILSKKPKIRKVREGDDYRSPSKEANKTKKQKKRKKKIKKIESASVHTFPNPTSDNTNPYAPFPAFHLGEEINSPKSISENKDMYSAQTMILPEIPLLNKKKKEKFQSSRLLAFYFFLPRLLRPRKFHIQRS